MKRRLLGVALAALTVMAGSASAGPNANGTLVVALSEGTVYSGDDAPYCGSVTAGSCEEIIASTSQEGAAVLNVLAAFPASSSPRVSGLTFGIDYVPGSGLSFTDAGHCGDFELPDGSWPDPGSGTAVTWASPQTARLTEVYWFAFYTYATYGAGTFCLIENPIQGADFADDDVPANLDPIAGLGCFGFQGADGEVPCPSGDGPVACCFDDGSCDLLLAADCETAGGVSDPGIASCSPNPCPQPLLGACCVGENCILRSAADCLAAGGVYQGDGTSCDDVDCTAVPTAPTTWGRVKGLYDS